MNGTIEVLWFLDEAHNHSYLFGSFMHANKKSLYVAYPKTNSLDWTCMAIDLNLGSRWSGGLILIEDNHP